MLTGAVSAAEAASEDAGVRRSDVVGWYLLEKESEIESEEQLMETKELVQKVLDRLIYKVKRLSDSRGCNRVFGRIEQAVRIPL